MQIEFYGGFKKSYKKRISPSSKLVEKTSQRIELFKNNPQDPVLKDHGLKGEKSHLRSFWITGDIRIIYFPESSDKVLFIDIGTHNQVY